MQNPHSKILERYRLRPQKKGRLPNFTKDFQEYTDRINQMIKNQERNMTQKQEDSTAVLSYDIKLPKKHLKYNQPLIRPDHKIKIRNKSSKNEVKQNSLPAIKEIKRQKEEDIANCVKLPRVNLTAREMIHKKMNVCDKENDPYNSKSSRLNQFQLHAKEKYYTKLFHIVTMGRSLLKRVFEGGRITVLSQKPAKYIFN